MKTITSDFQVLGTIFPGLKITSTNFKAFAILFILGLSPAILSAQFTISFGVTEPTCWGGSDGFITANINGGTAPYTFKWNTNQTTQTIDGVRAGTYTVTVTDADQNSKSASVEVQQPDQLKGTFSFSECDYPTVVTVTAKGGVAPYSYKWDNGPIGDTLHVLEPGKYCVTIIDANKCARVECVLVELEGLEVSVNMDMVTCPGDKDGELKVTILKGSGPYTFKWSNGGTGPIISNLAPGDYTVTVTDKAGCTTTATGTVKDKPDLEIDCEFEDPLCTGDENGFIKISVSGGTAPYSFLWNTGDTTSFIDNLGTGTYSVTVTDANGCTVEKEQVLFPLSSLIILGSATPESCPGENDGVLMAQGATGEEPYSYKWSNGAVSPTVTGVAPGEYTVTVTDAAGCSKEATLVVEPAEPFEAVLEVTPISVCEGDNGMLEVIVSPDTAVVTYLWNTGDTTAKITDLAPGEYSVTVINDNECEIILDTLLKAPPILEVEVNATLFVCPGTATGQAMAMPIGGTAPFTYTWSNGDTTQAIADLAAGTYIVTVVDANECMATDSVTISESAEILAIIEASETTCGASSDGSATVIADGGVAPYTYMWNTGETTESISDLTAGEYCVTVKDFVGCMVVRCVTIESDSLGLTLVGTNIDCFGDSTGTATATATNGMEPYAYLWNTGDTTASVDGLTAGEYSVTVTDTKGCEAADTIILTQPDTFMVVVMDLVDIDCFGDSTGSVTVMAMGGTGPYTFSWTDGEDGTTSGNQNIRDELTADIYKVVVTDALGCMAMVEIQISQADSIGLSLESTNLDCAGDNTGTISAFVTGGTKPFTFAWSNEADTNELSDLAAGTYVLTLTDANGCTLIDSVILTEPDTLNIAITNLRGACEDIDNGELVVTATGGVLPYTYSWSNEAETDTIKKLAPGEYSVTVIDANGCIATLKTLVEEYPALECIINIVQNESSPGAADGEASVDVTGGTAPFKYLWSNGDTTQEATGLSAGDYSVTVTDANGCTTTCQINLLILSGLGNYVWEDLDKDGIQDEGEPGVSGIPVKLKDIDDNIIARDTTDENGFYGFLDLLPGTYSVMFDIDSINYNYTTINEGTNDSLDNDVNFETMQMTPQVTLASGEINNTLDAGIYRRPFIGADPCECLNNATEDGNGQFSERITIESYPEETWTVVEQSGLYRVDSPDPPAAPIPIEVGTELTEFEPGMYELPTRIVDGEVYIILSTGNLGFDTLFMSNVCTYPRLNMDEIPPDSLCIIDDALELSSNPSIPGEVKYFLNGEEITEIDPSVLEEGDYEFIAQLIPFDPDECEARIVKTITLHSGCVAGLGNYVWEDINRDGIQDEGEPGVPNIPVKLKDADDNIIARDTTDEDGLYSFLNLAPGTYSVMFDVDIENYNYTILNEGANDSLDNDVNMETMQMTPQVTLVEGEINNTLDAGIYLRPAVGMDPCECLNNATEDGNGQFSERITVMSYPGEIWKVVEVSGLYKVDSPEPPAAPILIEPGTEFTEFAPGMYELPARLVDGEVYIALTSGNVGIDTVFTTNQCFYPRLNMDEIPGDSICVIADPLVLSSNPSIPGEVKYFLNGEEITEIDPAILEEGDYEFIAKLIPFDPNECEARIVKQISIHRECLAMIGDTVWLDQNRNGLQDPEEIGIAGVQVIAQQVGELSDSLDNLFRDTMFTDENGKYLFTVPPGVYKVTFGQPDGLTPTTANAGDDTRDSDIDPESLMTGLYTVNAGDVNLTIDAGFYEFCINVTDPGDIGYDQMLCGPGQDPDPIIETRAPEGGVGELEYLWMKSTITPVFNSRDWQAIPNSNTPNYDPGPLFETTYFTRCVRRAGCGLYLEPEPVTIKVNEFNQIDIEVVGVACVGEPLTLRAITDLTGPFTWTFDKPTTPATANGKTVVVTFDNFGTYEIRVMADAVGCTVSQKKTITVYNNPTVCGTELNIDLSVENERDVSIEWSVADDGTDFVFEVERSSDGYNFEKIATVTEPRAVIDQYKHYEYMDKEAKKGRNYYQVKIYEENLSNPAFTSEMEEVVVYGDSRLLLVYPNPVINDLKIEVFESLGEPIDVELFSINGVLLQRHELDPDTEGMQLNLEDYPKGTYFLKVQFGKTLVKRYKLVRY
jgi:hypothetical protein